MSFRAIVLDFDGVILESNEAKTEAFRTIFARFPEHFQASMDFHEKNAWKSRYEKIDHLVFDLLERPKDVALRDELVGEFSRLSAEALATVPFVNGALSFLIEFSALAPLVLVSVTPQADIDATLSERGLTQYFTEVYGCPPWTKVSAIADYLEKSALQGEEVVLVGDAPGDELAAAKSGVQFICRRSKIAFPNFQGRAFDDMQSVADYLRDRLT